MKTLLPYIWIARPDHWFKQFFMLPGLCLAFLFLRVLHKECYNGILQLRSSLCNTVQNVRQSGL